MINRLFIYWGFLAFLTSGIMLYDIYPIFAIVNLVISALLLFCIVKTIKQPLFLTKNKLIESFVYLVTIGVYVTIIINENINRVAITFSVFGVIMIINVINKRIAKQG